MTDQELNKIVVRQAFEELGYDARICDITYRAEEIKAEMLFFGLDEQAMKKRRQEPMVRWIVLVIAAFAGLAWTLRMVL